VEVLVDDILHIRRRLQRGAPANETMRDLAAVTSHRINKHTSRRPTNAVR
jgi:hypothetical protein